MGHICKHESPWIKWVKLWKIAPTKKMGHPVKNRLHCKKVGRAVKYGSNLEKWVALKWVTFGKDGSHCEIWKTFQKMGHSVKICHTKDGLHSNIWSQCIKWVKFLKISYNVKNDSQLEKWVALWIKGSLSQLMDE